MDNINVEELYRQLEGNYEVMLRRLKKDSMIQSFLSMFLEDEEFTRLEKAMEAGDDREAFEASHALKGVALNMEFGFLSKSLIELVESLRNGRSSNTEELYEQVRQDYAKTVAIIKGEGQNA